MNRLTDQTSPYLLQHKDNPVAWWPWGDAAFVEAKRTGKPVLLSVGYAACHWCHVMAHESFEDAGVADVMNRLFVNIKVDREERPDVDQVYMSALMALGEQGGWPLTMFLTPAREPFWGGTYFPKTDRYGRPGFTSVLQQVSRVFHDEPERVAKNSGAIISHLKQFAEQRPSSTAAVPLNELADGVLSRMDLVSGGLAGAPKFPNAPVLELLWRAHLHSGDERFAEAVLIALRAMCRGGIFDHVGGGFARYSTDEVWLAPHFEKMLYDNAQILDILSLVSVSRPEPEFAAAAAETVGWLQREMLLPGGAFASSLDADSEGREGAFYVWTSEEIDDVLGDLASAFRDAFDVRPHGNWEETNILNRLALAPVKSFEGEAFARERALLLTVRDGRERPGLDDKVLADWNGLLITAIARAAVAFQRPEWATLARDAYRFIRARLQVEGELHHSWRADRLGPQGMASDYASMARAALALYEHTTDPGLLDDAAGWLTTLSTTFRTGADGHLAMARPGTELPITPAPTHDDAVPNANALFLEAEHRWRNLTGDTRLASIAEQIAIGLSGLAGRQSVAYAATINALDLRDTGIEIVEVGNREASLMALPAQMIIRQRVSDINRLPATHVARSATTPEGITLVCGAGRCSAPLRDAEAVRLVVDEMMRAG